MKITNVSYQKAFATGPFLQEKIGFEAEIEDGEESVTAALTELKSLAEGWHNNNNPHLYQESGAEEYAANKMQQLQQEGRIRPTSSPQVIDYKQKESLEIAIDNATSLESLAEIKDACGKAGLVFQYMTKLNQLMVK